MMKRTLALFLALVLIVSLAACQKANSDEQRKGAAELQTEATALMRTIHEKQDTIREKGPKTKLNMMRVLLEMEPEMQEIITAYHALSPEEQEQTHIRDMINEWELALDEIKLAYRIIGTWTNAQNDHYVLWDDGTYQFNDREPWIWGIEQHPVTGELIVSLDGWKTFHVDEQNGIIQLSSDNEILTRVSGDETTEGSQISTTPAGETAPAAENNAAAGVTAVCPNCHQSVGEGMNFCPNCGAPLHEQTAAPVSEAPATPAETVQAAEPAANAPAVSGTPGTGTLEYSFGNGEGIIVLEDSYITVRLMRFYEQEVNWGSGPTIEKNVEFKIRNNSSSEYILNFQDAYIGEDGVQVSMYTGNTGPVPGKSNVYQYRISRQTGQNGDPLDSLDQLYALEGTFALSIYSADKSQINDRHEVGMKLQDIFSDAVVPAPVAPAAPVQDQSQEIEAALQGVWMLGADNSFTFQNGSISIVGGGSVLNGSYTVNTGDSMIDATVQASNGTVMIHLPYVYSNGMLSLYNNRNVQLTKQG